MAETPAIPSIFNDVLGPVMRGPSSSHSAASNRIGRLSRDLVEGDLRSAVIEYDPGGSLVTTHESQGTDMGLYAGFLGWAPDDPRLPDYRAHVAQSGLKIEVRYVAYGATHPNTYKLTFEGAQGEPHSLMALSTGGGIIEVIAVDGVPLRMAGDYFETLVYLEAAADAEVSRCKAAAVVPHERVELCAGECRLLRVSSRAAPQPSAVQSLRSEPGVRLVRVLRPVLPVLSRKDLSVPFQTAAAMLAWKGDRPLSLWELAAQYESARGGIGRDAVLDQARGVLAVMEAAVRAGLAGTYYDDRILPGQSGRLLATEAAGRLVPGEVLNRAIAYASAVMEVKSSMGLIVAAPTAGSCGVLPGAVLAVADVLGKDEEARAQALLAAGLIGVFIATHATLSAEVGGCTAECGSASGMAAAAVVGLAGGDVDTQLAAASMALQNSFGMTCDPIAGRVEAPCLGKNVLAAVNAIASANMALAGYRHLVPLDEVIEAMDQVGKALPMELRCTALGGLSITPASRSIEQALTGKGKSR